MGVVEIGTVSGATLKLTVVVTVWLFESVAASFRERSVAVILTGSGSDGAMGVRAVKKMGGTVIAQDEETAEFFGMPAAAIQTGCVDFILPLEEIPPALETLVSGDAG